jgi:hypothetical protein
VMVLSSQCVMGRTAVDGVNYKHTLCDGDTVCDGAKHAVCDGAHSVRWC